MILHDKVTLITETQAYDGYGQPIPGQVEREEVELPAEVQSINADATLERQTGLSIQTTRFRILLKPTSVDLPSVTHIEWGTYELKTDGEVEPHMLRGRLHHLELIARFERYRRP